MASLRLMRPIARQIPRSVPRPATRRFLNVETAPVLYSAPSKARGGRGEGHVSSHGLNVDLDAPTELGGAGQKTNPEELFAAAYGTCFQNAMNVTAKSMGINMPANLEDNIVETTVDLVGSLKELDMGIRINMAVKVKGVSKADLEKIVEKTKTICPYARATHGNAPLKVEVIETL